MCTYSGHIIRVSVLGYFICAALDRILLSRKCDSAQAQHRKVCENSSSYTFVWKAAIPSEAENNFKNIDIRPCDPNILSEEEFVAEETTDTL
jgi:hypothetical protein